MHEQASQYRNQRGTLKYLAFFFVVYPFGAFLYAVKDFGIQKAYPTILAFLVLYAFTFMPIPKSDGDTYKGLFALYTTYNFSDFWREIENTYVGAARNPDVYAPTLLFLCSRVSSDPQVFFAIAGIIYFVVFLKLMGSIRKLGVEDRVGWNMLYFTGCIFILNLSSGVNALRFPLAFMVFSLGAFMLIVTNRREYLLVSFLSGLIHFSLWFSCAFLILHVILGARYLYVRYGLLIIAIFLQPYFSDLLLQNSDVFGAAVETKVAGYTRQGFILTREEHKNAWNWYVQVNMYSTYAFVVIAVLLSRLSVFTLRSNAVLERLFAFLILLFVQGLLSGGIVDSISNRYVILFKFFGLVYLFYLTSWNPHSRLMKVLTSVYAPVLLLNVLVSLRADSFTISPYLLIGNLIMVLIFKSDIPVTEVF